MGCGVGELNIIVVMDMENSGKEGHFPLLFSPSFWF